MSGWENGDYVVETLGRNGMKLTERYRLLGGGDELLRRITFRSRAKEAVTVDQHFVREP
ncbi:MAG: hypothetical protein U5K76_04810 [Woeseiaceae bacterium]|nr:hypothetical protein [Woeseiaceae bacterium]